MSDPIRIATHNAVFLDFDGTLVDIASQPFTVTVPSELRETIVALHGALDGALAIISGRPIAEIDRYIDTRFCLPVAGVHGAEIRGANGYLTGPRDAEDFLCIIAAAERLSTRYPGLLVEHKPMAVAVHYRTKPHLADVVRKTLAAALETLPAMNMVEGKAVVEVKPEWANKGYAVTRLLQTPPFKSRLPIVIGDDATDEDGFRAALDAGGMAVKVGPGDTIATARLTSPAHVRDWLAAAVDELNREPNH